MRAAIWYGPREMRNEEVRPPEIRPDEVLLRVEAVGICGSELSGYLGQNSLRRPPLIMGHEFAGTIAAVGAQVTDRAVGERITVNPMVPDGTCVMCHNGAEHLCLNRSLIGAHRPGAFADYVAAPARACYPLPGGMDAITGTLVEPLACALRAVEHAQVTLGSRVLILGAGPIGLLALASARRAGASMVAISDVNPARLELARSLGATHAINPATDDLAAILRAATGQFGCDSAIDAVGLPVTRRQAMGALRPAGRAIFLGLHEDEVTLAGNTIVRSEITVQGSFCYTQANFTTAMRLLQDGAIPDVASWLTIRPLEEANASFLELIDAPAGTIKVILRP
ncbi:MAG: galactitol-1-phosphate 5-dehydrogenase [Thermomicrobiales bacterium]